MTADLTRDELAFVAITGPQQREGSMETHETQDTPLIDGWTLRLEVRAVVDGEPQLAPVVYHKALGGHHLPIALREPLERLAAALAAERQRAGALADALDMRPEVLAFAWLMERELRANDHKPGWKEDALPALFDRLDEEADELNDVICVPNMHSARIGSEAVDVANFALMIADNAGALDLEAARTALAAVAPGEEGADGQ